MLNGGRRAEIEFLAARDVPEVVSRHRHATNAGRRGIHQREPKHRGVLRRAAPDEQARSPVLRGELHPRRLAEVKAALEWATAKLERLFDPAGGQIVEAVDVGGRDDTAQTGRKRSRPCWQGRCRMGVSELLTAVTPAPTSGARVRLRERLLVAARPAR